MAGRVEDVQMAVPVARALSTSSKKASRRRRAGPRRRRSTGGGESRPAAPNGTDADPLGTVVDALRAWRLDEARQRAIAPFVILHDRTLIAIASSLPRSLAELHAIPGMGPAKLASYGEAILSVVGSGIEKSRGPGL
jgi:superfamily II DNA helicase RecQ